MTTLVWLTLALPLAGCVLVGLGSDRIPARTSTLVACGALLGSFLCAAAAFVDMLGSGADERTTISTLWTWVSAGRFHADVSVLYDPLAGVMLLIVTGVGFLIHVYSLGYMQGDPQVRRFFAYLNLFVFSMLLLVLASNFVLLLAGWGLVGLSSYLLIGFWHDRPSAVAAAKKAFVMNAIGDVGIAIAAFLIFRDFGSVAYADVFSDAVAGRHTGDVGWICFLLLVGACAKSAQLPLHTWLPDAMEGPTPVSALIHAATMVTAGVYLIARMNPLYELAPGMRHLIILIGCLGLLMAGAIACVQTDIKRIIAYSTMSQIAYMFVGVGVGAYWAGIFHLFTHAFFKALLFLGAGVVIHALGDEQDVRRMGGLRRLMPKTYLCMVAGSLALAGIIPFSGAWSKDSILAGAFSVGDDWTIFALVCGLIGAVLTGFYSFRLIFLVFHGEPSEYAAEEAPKHLHHGEGPKTMLYPVYLLGVLATVAGLLQIPGVTHIFSTFLEPIAPRAMVEASSGQDWLVTAIGTACGAVGILLAWRIYGAEGVRSKTRPIRPLAVVAERKFYWDELYDRFAYRPAVGLAQAFRLGIEAPIILEPLDSLGTFVRGLGSHLSSLQTGIVRAYAFAFSAGVVVLAIYFMVRAA
jgi:NADH-quinone oxidoreductase subunit L